MRDGVPGGTPCTDSTLTFLLESTVIRLSLTNFDSVGMPSIWVPTANTS